AQGQAMIKTATAFTNAWASRGCGPTRNQMTNVTIATAITAGTNHADTRSAIRWIGARLRCACATSWTIWDNIVSRPTLRASTTRAPDWLIVPPMTFAPTSLVTGIDSPVTIDSATAL